METILLFWWALGCLGASQFLQAISVLTLYSFLDGSRGKGISRIHAEGAKGGTGNLPDGMEGRLPTFWCVRSHPPFRAPKAFGARHRQVACATQFQRHGFGSVSQRGSRGISPHRGHSKPSGCNELRCPICLRLRICPWILHMQCHPLSRIRIVIHHSEQQDGHTSAAALSGEKHHV